MSNLIEIMTNSPNMFSIYQEDKHGGVRTIISPGYELDEMMYWYRTEKERARKEIEIRAKYPAVEEAYQQYQLTIKLVS